MSPKNRISLITYARKNFLPGFFIYLNKLDSCNALRIVAKIFLRVPFRQT